MFTKFSCKILSWLKNFILAFIFEHIDLFNWNQDKEIITFVYCLFNIDHQKRLGQSPFKSFKIIVLLISHYIIKHM